jgi:GNAT superfamily N-acetyltransferase
MIDASFAPVHASERRRALDVLVSAFTADPVIRWLYPEDQSYPSVFPGFLEAFGGRAFSEGTAWRLRDYAAVALWLGPGIEPDGDAIVAYLLSTVAPAQHEDLESLLGQMDDAHPRYPIWYLPWFGVDAASQGKGIGSELMAHCLTIVDGDHMPAYLETPNPRNITFYERHGFEVVGVSQAGACPPVISMLRATRP